MMSSIRLHFAIPILVLTAATAAGAFPASVNGDADGMSLIGRWAEGSVRSVATNGDMFVFNHGGIIELHDYTTPSQPVPVAQFVSPTIPELMCLSGDRLVACDGYHDLTVVDLSNPANPIVGSSVSLGKRIQAIAMTGSWVYAFTDDNTAGREITPVDVGDPVTPIVYPAVAAAPYSPLNFGDDVAAEPGRLVSFGQNRVTVYSLSTPAVPTLLGQWPASGTNAGSVGGGLAYVGRGTGTLSLDVLDIGGSGTPVLVGHTEWPGAGYGLRNAALSGSTVFLLAADGTLHACGVTDPTAPVHLDSEYVGSGYSDTDLAATTARIFVVNGYGNGLTVVGGSDPSALVPLSTTTYGGEAYGVAVDFDRAYVYAHEDYVEILDISQPSTPVQLGRVDTGDEVWGFDACGDYLYVCNDDFMVGVYDVSLPSMPVLIDDIGSGEGEREGYLCVSDGLVYVGGDGGLSIVDVRDPFDLSERGVYELGSDTWINEFIIQGQYVYGLIHTWGTLTTDLVVIDVLDPDDPQLVASYAFAGEGKALAVDGDVAWVAIDIEQDFVVTSSTIHVLDISDPTLPFELHALPVAIGEVSSGQTGRSLVADNGFLYADVNHQGVQAWDVSDPTAPIEHGYFNTGHTVRGLEVAFNRIFAVDWFDGLYILGNDALVPIGVTPAVAPLALSHNYPNPFNPTTTIAFDLPAPAAVDLDVFDAVGRRVRTLLRDEAGIAGRNHVVWNGCDDTGRPAASGVYLYSLRTGATTVTRTMMLIK